MEVLFSPETEEQLQQAAASAGKTPVEFVTETVSDVLRRRTEIRAGVRRGIEAADRGELIEHEEAMRQLDALLEN